MSIENRTEKNITVSGSKIYGQIPKYFIAITLIIMFFFPDRISTILHGTPISSLEAGKINNGKISQKKLISFWTPSACTDSGDNETCTHYSLKKSYLESCIKQSSDSRFNCKKLKKRIENGYYFVTGKQIRELGNTLLRAKSDGFNYFTNMGASRGSPVKPGLWWEVTFSKNSDIDVKKLKEIVNDSFSRKKKPDSGKKEKSCGEEKKKCTYSIKNKEKEPLNCWFSDKERPPLISVYAEIRE